VAPDACITYRPTLDTTCRSHCLSGEAKPTFRASDAFFGVTADEIKWLLYRDGPLQTLMSVFDDFYVYTDGVYRRTYGEKKGGHSVTLVGWGADADGTPYWIAQNSWGTLWGMHGDARIAIDDNGCDFAAVAGAGAVASFDRVSMCALPPLSSPSSSD